MLDNSTANSPSYFDCEEDEVSADIADEIIHIHGKLEPYFGYNSATNIIFELIKGGYFNK